MESTIIIIALIVSATVLATVLLGSKSKTFRILGIIGKVSEIILTFTNGWRKQSDKSMDSKVKLLSEQNKTKELEIQLEKLKKGDKEI